MRNVKRVGASAACGGISPFGGTIIILHLPVQSVEQNLLPYPCNQPKLLQSLRNWLVSQLPMRIVAANYFVQPYKP